MENEQVEAQQQTTRRTFEEEFFAQYNEFCDKAIKDIPELHGLAIIPIWTNQPEKSPSGVLRLRNPNPPYLNSLMLLLTRLSVFGADVHSDLVRQLRMFDQYADELAARIKEQQELLEQIAPEKND
jgi:hypothetical protein